jgi:hypothetical protein
MRNLFRRDSQAVGGVPSGKRWSSADLDHKINWSMRSNVTVGGKDSKKPPGATGTAGTPNARFRLDHKPPQNVPVENYYGKQSSAPSNSQYSRSFNDYTPINFRRKMGDVSGVSNVQLINPVATTSRKRIVLYTAAGYLWAIVPRIPGQTRDNFAGFHTRGIDPQSYAALIAAGPGSQPSNPGGPGKIAGRNYIPPSVAGGINNSRYGAGS